MAEHREWLARVASGGEGVMGFSAQRLEESVNIALKELMGRGFTINVILPAGEHSFLILGHKGLGDSSIEPTV